MLQLFSANENKESKTGGLEPHVLLIHNTIKYFYVKQRGLQIQIVVSWFNTFSSTPLFFFPFLKLPFSRSLLCQMAYAHSMLSESAGTDFSSSRGTGLSTAFQGSVEENIDDTRSLLQCKTNFLWLSGCD